MSNGHIWRGTDEEAKTSLTLDANQRHALLHAYAYYLQCKELGFPIKEVKFTDGVSIEFQLTLSESNKKPFDFLQMSVQSELRNNNI